MGRTRLRHNETNPNYMSSTMMQAVPPSQYSLVDATCRSCRHIIPGPLQNLARHTLLLRQSIPADVNLADPDVPSRNRLWGQCRVEVQVTVENNH